MLLVVSSFGKGTPGPACPGQNVLLVCILLPTETILKERYQHQVNKSYMILGYVIRPLMEYFLPMIKCYCCHYQAVGLYLSTYDRPRFSDRSWDNFKGRSSHPMSNIPVFWTFLILLYLSAPPKLIHKADACCSPPTNPRGRAEGTQCHAMFLTLGYHRILMSSIQILQSKGQFLILPYWP